MGKGEKTIREDWYKILDDILNQLQEDKEKILDIIMDKCQGLEISIPLYRDEVPRYEIKYSKVCIETIKGL